MNFAELTIPSYLTCLNVIDLVKNAWHQDVVVDLIEGLFIKEREKPIITKQAFNAVTLPPYQLPANKTKTVWRSRLFNQGTYKSEGFNGSFSKESRWKTKRGMKSSTLKLKKTWLPTSSMITSPTLGMTKKSVSPMIKSPRSTTTNTSPSKANNAPKSASISWKNVEGNRNTEVGNNAILEAKNEVHMISKGTVILDAGSQLTLRGGDSFITLDDSGISMVGAKIKINTGGTALKGSGFTTLQSPTLKAIVALEGLAKEDGESYSSGSPDTEGAVKALQQALNALNLPVKVDGLLQEKPVKH